MKTAITVFLVISMQLAYAQTNDPHAGHHSKATGKQQVMKKFVPTEDLKVRMEKLLGLMKELKGKKPEQKQVKEYGDKIANVVKDIIKTCKLEPDADAAIHPVLGSVLEGTEEFKKGNFESGYAKIQEGLLDYEKLFSHRGWSY